MKIKPCDRNLVGANNGSQKSKRNSNFDCIFRGKRWCEEGTTLEEEERLGNDTYNWAKRRQSRRQKVFRRGKGEYQVEFIVVESLLTPILIGFPSMEEIEMVIDTRKGTLSIGNLENEIVMPYKRREEVYVCVTERC